MTSRTIQVRDLAAPPVPTAGRNGLGLALALVSAVCFGMSGSFATALLQLGWTPSTAVTVRITVAALVLTPPALYQLRGHWRTFVRSWRLLLSYGLLAVAGAQLFFFNAVAHLSVGVALLLEYLGIVLVVGWMWVRHGQSPRRLTVLGAAVGVAGLVLVLDLLGTQRLDVVGVLWGLAAAAGLAMFYLQAATPHALPGLVLAWAGLSIGAVGLVIAALTGLLPFHAPTGSVEMFGLLVSWIVPVLGISLLSAALAYVAGIGAARLLGAKVASFVGLLEVVAAVVLAWLMLGQVPTAMQLAGGALIIGGVVLVKLDDVRVGDGDRRPRPID